MANLIRSAKSGSDWTESELAAYHITIVPQNKQEFFGLDDLPAPASPSLAGFMTIEDREHAMDRETRKLLHYLDLALDPKVGQEAAVDNFAAKLLEKLGYDDGDRIIFIRRALPFLICGVSSFAQTDVCVMDDNEVLLLVQEDKRLLSLKDPEPQVVAEAIAAYALNNKVRVTSLNLPSLPAITLPAITMIGTNPIFYKITVTAELSSAVQQGTYPTTETRVFRYIPVLPRRHSLGMRPLENRVEILACLEAFKRFLGN
ncbi:hypothetical protein L208DRAFT_1352965 [Tricholoma matsutake]|nr:hypothetical protein L208DRAFT_1352965 [Tricholoma matsutake 945]